MTIRFHPLTDRLLVRPDQSVNMTKSGLYIPDAAKEKPTMGTVVVTGPGKINTNPGIPNRYLPLEVKKGNKILYGQFAGTVVKIDSEEFILLREEDVMGVIED